jgi:transcriptional regulator with XRE-family HTH domain
MNRNTTTTISPYASDDVVLRELGSRIAETRVRLETTQRDLADEAGVGIATVKRLEAGRAIGTDNLLRILRALGLIENLDRLVPPPPPSPIERLEQARGERRRARASRGRDGSRGPAWRWGDEASRPSGGGRRP